MGVSDYMMEECHSSMIHENMNISCIMFHAQHGEESRLGEIIDNS